MLASLVEGATEFHARDPARAEALSLRARRAFRCEDLAPFLYASMLADGLNPYFSDFAQKFSAEGMRIQARHIGTLIRHQPNARFAVKERR